MGREWGEGVWVRQGWESWDGGLCRRGKVEEWTWRMYVEVLMDECVVGGSEREYVNTLRGEQRVEIIERV